jgi:hypothetical protein
MSIVFFRIIIFISAVFAPLFLMAQSYQSSFHNCNSLAKVNLANITVDFKPVLQNIEAPVPGGNSYASFLLEQKQKIKTAPNAAKKTAAQSNAEDPFVLAGFEGNAYDGSVPCDNDVAISNDNMLVSVANSTIYMFDLNQDSLIKSISLEAFSDTLGLPANKYDPKVRYDPKADRFIMVFLSGSSSTSTDIIVCFSETNDPTGNWFLYSIAGNPFSDSSWSDYPIIALTDDELFITVNLLNDDTLNTPDSWKYLFKESVIWQINKQSGYSGATLQTKLYNDIKLDNRAIRNLCPIQGGATTTGPNIYLLSNRNFDLANDTFFILEVTNTYDNPNTQLLIDYRISSTPYGLAPDGQQSNNHFLMTNDSRILGGFIENDKIHFVMNCLNPDTARSAIYHGIVNNISGSKTFSGNIIGNESLDYGYPNISYTGKYAGDEEAIINFNHTSLDTIAGVSAMFYNGTTQEYSERMSLKTGDSYVNVLPGGNERWGDYSGSQRKYNEPGKVWITGFFGTRRQTGGPAFSRMNWTWVGALQSPDTAAVAGINEKKNFSGMKTYPNPSSDIFTTEFELQESAFINIELVNAEGKQVKMLFQDKAKKGKNKFSFATDHLANGAYTLVISSQGKIISTSTILKQQH